MHMSSACPRGWTPGQQGEYVGEYKGELVSLPYRGKFTTHITHSHNYYIKQIISVNPGVVTVLWQLCACLQFYIQDKSLGASSLGHSGSWAGKGRRACNYIAGI